MILEMMETKVVNSNLSLRVARNDFINIHLFSSKIKNSKRNLKKKSFQFEKLKSMLINGTSLYGTIKHNLYHHLIQYTSRSIIGIHGYSNRNYKTAFDTNTRLLQICTHLLNQDESYKSSDGMWNKGFRKAGDTCPHRI